MKFRSKRRHIQSVAIREEDARRQITRRILCVLSLVLVLTATVLYGADKGEKLVEKYKAAHEVRDIDALKGLVYWKGASERTRETIEQRLVVHLHLEIESIEFRPLTGDETCEKLGYQSNLKPVGWLAMFFKPPRSDSRLFGGECPLSDVISTGQCNT